MLALSALALQLALAGDPDVHVVYTAPPASPNNQHSRATRPSPPKKDCAAQCKAMAEQCVKSCREAKDGNNDRDCRGVCSAMATTCKDSCASAPKKR